MNSLFGKILLWLVITAIITSLGAVIVTVFFPPSESIPSAIPGRIVALLAVEADHAFTEGGVSGLEHFLARIHNQTGMDAHLLDSAGRDLVTHSSFLSERDLVRRSRFQASLAGRRLVAGRATGNDRTFLIFPNGRPGFLPQHLWILASLILLCYLLARHLTSPLRRVESAVQQFGAGNLAARAPVQRDDEVGRLATRFNEMAVRIEMLIESQKRLLLDVSHELRSPLARLNVAVELARSSENPAVELNVIQQQADRLETLIKGLLQRKRSEQEVDLTALLRQTVEDCRLEGAITLAAEPAIRLQADPELLRRALENPIRNAIRHSAGVAVAVTLRREGNMAVLMVRDHGPGVPEHSLPQLFDAFYRVDSEAAQGAGLGLWITRRAVELHGGRVRASNAKPGLAISLELPIGEIGATS